MPTKIRLFIERKNRKGLEIYRRVYDILKQIDNKPIKHQITDLYDKEGSPSGTRVEVWEPVEG